MREANGNTTAVMVTQAPEEVLSEVRAIDQEIAFCEHEAADLRARLKEIHDRTTELMKALRMKLRADQALPLFEVGRSTDEKT